MTGVDPTPRPCSEDEFKCSNKHCISQHLACDDIDDCGDQSDETGCSKYLFLYFIVVTQVYLMKASNNIKVDDNPIFLFTLYFELQSSL